MFEERQYQLDDVNYAMDHGPDVRPIHCIATGGGKTLCQAMIAKRELDRGNPTAIVTPRIEIFDQTHSVVSEILGASNVATLKAGSSWRPYLPVHIVSWDTLIARIKRDPFWYPDVKRFIVDEAHLSLSPRKNEVLDHYAEANILIDGYTATPARKSGKGLGDFYTNIKHVISIRELINRGYLAPCEYWGGKRADLQSVHIRQGDYVTKELSEASAPLIGDVVDNWGRLASDRHTIVFAVDIAHCEALTERFQQAGVKAASLHIHKTPQRRREIVEAFRKQTIQVLVNVSIGSYGFDVPSISCVVLARPTRSVVLWLQAIGRGMRPYPGKDFCMIIDHTGGVRDPQLGYAEELRRWTLNKRSRADTNWSRDARNTEKKPDEEKVHECEQCEYLFSRSLVCPKCGTEIPLPKRDIASTNEDLVRLSKRKKDGHKEPWPEPKAFYLMLRYHAVQHGYKSGWAYWKFKEKMNCVPSKSWNTGPTMVPTVRVNNWIRSRQIAYAKAKKRNDARDRAGTASQGAG